MNKTYQGPILPWQSQTSVFWCCGVKWWQNAPENFKCSAQHLIQTKDHHQLWPQPFYLYSHAEKAPFRSFRQTAGDGYCLSSPKSLKNVLALKTATLCNPWSRRMCLSVGAMAFCTAGTWLSYASTDTVNAGHSRHADLSASCHGVADKSFWELRQVKVC